MKELGIYIHIPFCAKKCDYCDFVSYSNKDNIQEDYIKTLIKEIEYKRIEYKDYIVSTIFFGGGTPSYINPEYIEMILNQIKEKFKLDQKLEITIEVNPGTVNTLKLKKYYKMGINRLSIGMQSIENKILKEIGRIHNCEEFLKTYDLAKKIGFKNINIDSIIGLPGQNIENIKKQVNKIIKLNPEHISMYSLILEEDTKLKMRINNEELFLPNEIEERKIYWETKKILENNGYIHYEISNFSKPGFESKHNLNCWKQKEYIGYGVAAHSYLNDIRFKNVDNIEEYIKSINNIKKSFELKKLKDLKMKNKYKDFINLEEKQTLEEKENEYMILGLRKIEGIKISEFKNKFIENPIYKYREILEKLSKQELLRSRIGQYKTYKKRYRSSKFSLGKIYTEFKKLMQQKR